jgi:hypothetical protein
MMRNKLSELSIPVRIVRAISRVTLHPTSLPSSYRDNIAEELYSMRTVKFSSILRRSRTHNQLNCLSHLPVDRNKNKGAI